MTETPESPVTDSAPEDVPSAPPANLWQKMKADPEYAPEHLALEAVERLGPQARDGVARLHQRYPGANAEGLADLVIKKFVNQARLSGAAAGATGLPGAVVDVGVLAWTQARMVLQLAAVYGLDPTHPDRAAELLVLQKIHKYAEGARMALGVAAGRERIGSLMARGNTPAARVFVQLSLRLAKMAGVAAGKKLFAKIVPGAAVILGTWANSSATKALAKRTVALYRQPRQLTAD